MIRSIVAAACLATALPGAALAEACLGRVTDLRPVTHYDPARGEGFLAVRSGPGTAHQQLGELYLGDEVAVLERAGNWLYVECLSGWCEDPFRGDPLPRGWAYARHLRLLPGCS